jgi:hypothetical protein
MHPVLCRTTAAMRFSRAGTAARCPSTAPGRGIPISGEMQGESTRPSDQPPQLLRGPRQPVALESLEEGAGWRGRQGDQRWLAHPRTCQLSRAAHAPYHMLADQFVTPPACRDVDGTLLGAGPGSTVLGRFDSAHYATLQDQGPGAVPGPCQWSEDFTAYVCRCGVSVEPSRSAEQGHSSCEPWRLLGLIPFALLGCCPCIF